MKSTTIPLCCVLPSLNSCWWWPPVPLNANVRYPSITINALCWNLSRSLEECQKLLMIIFARRSNVVGVASAFTATLLSQNSRQLTIEKYKNNDKASYLLQQRVNLYACCCCPKSRTRDSHSLRHKTRMLKVNGTLSSVATIPTREGGRGYVWPVKAGGVGITSACIWTVMNYISVIYLDRRLTEKKNRLGRFFTKKTVQSVITSIAFLSDTESHYCFFFKSRRFFSVTDGHSRSHCNCRDLKLT